MARKFQPILSSKNERHSGFFRKSRPGFARGACEVLRVKQFAGGGKMHAGVTGIARGQ